MNSPLGAAIVAPTPGNSEGNSGHVATRMLINILLQFHPVVHVFTRSTAVFEFDDGRIYVHQYSKPCPQSSWVLRLLGQLVYQLKFAIGIAKHSRNLGVIIFGGGGFVIPALVARGLLVYVLYRIGGVTYKEVPRDTLRQQLWSRFLKAFRTMQYGIAHSILVLSPSLEAYADVGRFKSKCRVWNHYYFDLELFINQLPYSEDRNILGHIGVSRTKGTLRLLEGFDKADLPEEYELVIIGDGPQFKEANKYSEKRNLNVEFTGYIDRSELPKYYNEMKLFINCSVSEGVPKAMFEAMACGTPVAATPVGGIPDYITDCENGFIMANRGSEELANDLENILKKGDLESVSQHSRQFVQDNFSFQSTVESYYKLITEETSITVSPPPKHPDEPVKKR